jgi:hypothetical protein
MDKITSMNVNTSIQRSITKACARHGLSLYIYAGEDLPDIPVWEDKNLREEYIRVIKENIAESDYDGVKQLWRELTKRQINTIWSAFDGSEHIVIKESLRVLEKVV